MIVRGKFSVDGRADSVVRVRAGAILSQIHADAKLSTLIELSLDPAHVYFTLEREVTAVEDRAPRDIQLVGCFITILEDYSLVR